MLFERIESPSLAHYSYIIGDGGKAIVIDPRRDCGVYLNLALRSGLRISHVLETHRNEDYVVGSRELAERCGARIWHADSELDYQYGEPVKQGQSWGLGSHRIEALATPGHTPGSMSYLLHDPVGEPWMIFTGDALFAGDVGRVDLMGEDRLAEMASLLHDSIFDKILPLGDHVLVCPAHGAGSVCGTAIAQRIWTTIGLEKRLNPKLQLGSRQEFVDQVAHMQQRPPYFRRMEEWNLGAAPLLGTLPVPPLLNPGEMGKFLADAVVLDTRSELAFGAGHVPGSISIWQNGVASFAGWFLSYDQPLLLVDQQDDPSETVRLLLRIGYDRLEGCLAGGLTAWHKHGEPSQSISTVTVQALCGLLDDGKQPFILDVRSREELESEGRIGDATHIHLTQLPKEKETVPQDQTVHIFCGSGLRSMIAASLLKKWGHPDLRVVLGGLAGWNSISCPVEL